jgi:hypothetical protein
VALRDRLPTFVGLAAGFLLWSMVMTGASILLNSVIEEKSSKILEVLLSSASVPEIMGGKILGVAGLTLTVLGIWALAGWLAMINFAPGLAGDLVAVLLGKGLVLYFGAYLVGGYLMYAALFAGIGAFCESQRDAQTLLGPIMIVMTIPMVFMSQAIRSPDSPMLSALSWIPPFTPFLMPVRIAGDPPVVQVVGTTVLMILTTAAIIAFSTRAFHVGALATGKVDLKTLLGLMCEAAGRASRCSPAMRGSCRKGPEGAKRGPRPVKPPQSLRDSSPASRGSIQGPKRRKPRGSPRGFRNLQRRRALVLPADRLLRHRQQAFALGALAGQLTSATNGFGLLASALFRRLFIMHVPLHFAERAFALHLLLQGLQRLIDVVVADENLDQGYLSIRQPDQCSQVPLEGPGGRTKLGNLRGVLPGDEAGLIAEQTAAVHARRGLNAGVDSDS